LLGGAAGDEKRREDLPKTVRIRAAMNNIDVSGLLKQVTVPTLVMHCHDDAVVPFEEGRLMATGILGSRFVALQSSNHLILPGEPAQDRFLEAVRAFLTDT
jgi:pimeloyl-ACP methyl ester carboxylesterase